MSYPPVTHHSESFVNNGEQLSDLEYQHFILQGVSRTFALTIPQLPADLIDVVGNAYLLCRIADTIEDETSLTAEQKQQFSQQFVAVLENSLPAEAFSTSLLPLLSDTTIAAEKDLIQNTPKVIRLFQSFSERQRSALHSCISIMSAGMSQFQMNYQPDGLKDMEEMGQYCYHVAGVVGEMLTELYCEYSDEIAAHKDTMMNLAVSFGQGLQMTNILKDIWVDQARGACWLPRDIFAKYGLDLKHLNQAGSLNSDNFAQAFEELTAITHAHLRNALRYTLLLPRNEKGLRKFCFWAIGMAVMTLVKLANAAKSGSFAVEHVKISRRSVKVVMVTTHLAVGSNRLLTSLFNFWARSLPAPQMSVTLRQ